MEVCDTFGCNNTVPDGNLDCDNFCPECFGDARSILKKSGLAKKDAMKISTEISDIHTPGMYKELDAQMKRFCQKQAELDKWDKKENERIETTYKSRIRDEKASRGVPGNRALIELVFKETGS